MKNKQLYTILLLSSLTLLQAKTKQETAIQTTNNQPINNRININDDTNKNKERKDLAACVLEATNQATLKQLLTENGFKNVADAFNGVKGKIAAFLALKKLDKETQEKVKEVATAHQQHLMKILAL